MKFIWGQESYLINREVKKLIKEKGQEPTFYNENSSVDEIDLEVNTIGLFSEEKVIVIRNHPTLVKSSETKRMVEVIKNLDESIEIIFTLEAKRIAKTNDLIKFLLANADVKEFARLSTKEVVPTIKDIVASKGGSISNMAAIKLAGKVPNDLRIIIAEIEKLLLEDSEITEDMVDISIGEYLKDDAFGLSNAIIEKDALGIMSSYKSKVAQGEEATLIIGQISSVFNLALKVASFKRQGLSNNDISDKLSMHIFRVKKSADLISMTSQKILEELIIDLAQLDKDIKTGVVDKDKGLEHYLLKLIK